MTHSPSTLRQATRAFAIAIFLCSPFLGLPAHAAEPAAPPAQAAPATTQPGDAAAQPEAQRASRSEIDGYAVREQAANALQKFQGGDTVIIVGGTTVVIVILVILVIVLI